MNASRMWVYIAHPITGLTYEQVAGYYAGMVEVLREGYECLYPMIGKSYLRVERESPLKSRGYTYPVSTDHAIVERDRWMVGKADVLLVDLSGAQVVSIGCVMELAWAGQLGKHTVVVMEPGSVHDHAFVRESADVVFGTLQEAVEYLLKLSLREM